MLFGWVLQTCRTELEHSPRLGPHPLSQDGQLVTFAEVQGMTELNSHKPIKVINCKRYSFQLDIDTSSFGDYARGGLVTQFKEPKVTPSCPELGPAQLKLPR